MIATFIAGCGSSTVLTTHDAAPSALSYSQPSLSAVVNQAVSAEKPTVTGTVSSYAVAPSLPSGLSLDTSTGMISGTPTTVTTAASYTVTASNVDGATTAVLQIAVVRALQAPSSLTYPLTSISAGVGQAIAADTPTVTGPVTSYSVSPSLPAGLTMNITNGAISGTPTAASVQAPYTVTATNSAGSTTATLQIAVAAQVVAPSGLVYPQDNINGTLGVAITVDTPTVSGTVVSYTVSPALPTGLTISSSAGSISGVPTAATLQATYTVTATNSAGETKATLQIAVTAQTVAPSALTYPQNTINATTGVAITADRPTVTGTVNSYTVSPALPAGLAIDAVVGTISGTPTSAVSQTAYAVTASNPAGSTTTTVQIAVAAAAPTPAVLRYNFSPLTGSVGVPFQEDRVGGSWSDPVTTFTISPALPAGMVLNSTDGDIFGTPTAAAPATTYTVTATNSNGVAVGTVQLTVNPEQPPGGILYSQTSINAYVGEPIWPDSGQPNYYGVGPVSSYSVSPALPAGLNLSQSTGTIAGTPTVATSTTTYSIYETNAAGSTPVAVQITVGALRAPTALVYPQSSIVTYTGQAITPDIPGSSGGPISSFSISPALPAGLSMDTSTGIISGTPTATSAQTNYVVTGTNSAGSISSANTSITVTDPPIILMQVGTSQYPVIFANDNVFSGSDGPWTLWNYQTGTAIISGDSGLGSKSLSGSEDVNLTSQMAGPTLAIGIPGGIEVLSSVDGHPIGNIVSPGYMYGEPANTPPPYPYPPTPASPPSLNDSHDWQLAPDGSYISIETQAGIYIYSPSGQLLFSEPGDYVENAVDFSGGLTGSTQTFFAATGQLMVAGGPAAANAVESISIPGGSSIVESPYQGQFLEWFGDGSHFVSWNGQSAPDADYYYYSNSSVQQWASQIAPAGGWGNWIWAQDISNALVAIFPIGSTTAALTYNNWDFGGIGNSGPTLAFLPQTQALAVIDLSGSTPVETDYTVPQIGNWDAFSYPATGLYAAESASKWVLGFYANGIFDGSSATSTPRYIGSGAVTNIVGGSSEVAVAVGNEEVNLFTPPNTKAIASLPLATTNMEISSDGSVLAATDLDSTALNIYSLPSGTVSNTFNYSGNWSFYEFALSGSGTTLAQIQDQASPDREGPTNYQLQVSPISGSPITWSGTSQTASGIVLSPDGTAFAVSNSANTNGVTTYSVTLYKNGAQVATAGGSAVGWLDNGRLLVQNWVQNVGFSGSTIYSSTGAIIATPPLPHIDGGIQPVTSDTIYSVQNNTIYSLTTGQPTWTGPYPADDGSYFGVGAVAGPYVVYESEGNVIAVPY